MNKNLIKKCAAELTGTAALILAVIGSGIMGENLSNGNHAIALLANALATVGALYILISLFSAISGAHFNPVVTTCTILSNKTTLLSGVLYICFQTLGAVGAVYLTHYLFGLEIIQESQKLRTEFRLCISEFLATFGLLFIINAFDRISTKQVAIAVALYIGVAYWATPSTSFANPAATLARSLTDTFSGIHYSGVLGFIIAQFLGGILGFFTAEKFIR